MQFTSLPQMFFARAEEWADRPRYRVREGATWREVTWRTMATGVREIASALIEAGVQPGDRVALLCGTRPEWMAVDLAILACAGLTIPIYPSNLPAECGYILANSGSTLAFVENPKQRGKIDDLLQRGFELDGVRHTISLRQVVQIDGTGEGTLAALMARGRAALARNRPEIERRIAAIELSELATIVYTSGTTGPPKGVMQTHGNHLAAVSAAVQLGMAEHGQVDFFFLPLAHSFARMVEYLGLAVGSVTAFARSIDTLAEDMAAARPHLVPAVPRIFEKVYARIQAARDGGSVLTRTLFDWAVRIGRARLTYEEAGRPVPLHLQALNAVAHRVVFSRMHATLGGKVRYMVSGGAPLAREICEFFHIIGLPVLEGYGLTETTPLLSANRPGKFRIGTVGAPIAGVELRLAEDGEILARGPNVALGYYRRPEATAEAWDTEGWFHTGDIGEIDADGFLRITDRKKDLLKTSGGKYIAPQKIENLLKLQPLISQAVVIGDNRKYCVALLTLEQDEISRWAAAQGVSLSTEAMADDERVRAAVEAQVAEVNRALASFESIKYFRILPGDFSPESGELTPSLKVKRKVVAERYRNQIEEMYS